MLGQPMAVAAAAACMVRPRVVCCELDGCSSSLARLHRQHTVIDLVRVTQGESHIRYAEQDDMSKWQEGACKVRLCIITCTADPLPWIS